MSYGLESAGATCQSFSPLLVAPASVADVPLLAHPVSPYLPAATQGPFTSARGVTAICVDATVSSLWLAAFSTSGVNGPEHKSLCAIARLPPLSLLQPVDTLVS